MAAADFAIATQPELADVGLRSLYEYWQRLAANAAGLPALPSFDPLQLPRLLPNVWIVEVEPATHRFRMRLTGESINAIYGRNIAGLYFREVSAPADFDRIVRRYSTALGEPAIYHAGESVYAAGGLLSVGERLGLPMVGRSGRTDTLFGATTYRTNLNGRAHVAPAGDEPCYHRIHAANHRTVEIAGG